jgi:putative CocE/NonD family hydrolase
VYRPPRDRRPFIAGGAVVVLVLALVVTYFVTRGGGSNSSAGGIRSDVHETIPVDGAALSAEVITPKHDAGAPLLVIPGAWGAAVANYRAVATEFAQSGYQVVVYAQRGLGGSTGNADFAGSATQKDVSAVIDWALKNTHADPDKIGMFGISYGAGISLLAAARDPRIKAVTALSTWTDMAESYDQYGTPNVLALTSLIGGQQQPDRHYDEMVMHLRRTLLNSPVHLGPLLQNISPTRSPEHYVKQINRNGTAIMIANAFEDSLLNPRQLLPFFSALTTPKRLELAAGDHGGPELSALSGDTSNQTVNDAQAWLDHYVRGTDNGVQTEDPIVLRDVRTDQLHTYRKWPTASSKDRVTLAQPGLTPQTGLTVNPIWTATIQHAGTESGATSGPPQLGNPRYIPPSGQLTSIKASDAFVWNGPALAADLPIAGTPSVKLSLSSTSKVATIYLHFYDVSPSGSATLVDFQPYTAPDLSGTKPSYVTIEMQPISWTVPGGDHLALVVDTYDPRYQSLTPAGNSVSVSSTAANPASFTVPVAR